MNKNFDDFIYTIDNDTYETIIAAAKQAMSVSCRSNCNDEAFFIALELLKHYHNWINL